MCLRTQIPVMPSTRQRAQARARFKSVIVSEGGEFKQPASGFVLRTLGVSWVDEFPRSCV